LLLECYIYCYQAFNAFLHVIHVVEAVVEAVVDVVVEAVVEVVDYDTVVFVAISL
jgi:hypothetical protein